MRSSAVSASAEKTEMPKPAAILSDSLTNYNSRPNMLATSCGSDRESRGQSRGVPVAPVEPSKFETSESPCDAKPQPFPA